MMTTVNHKHHLIRSLQEIATLHTQLLPAVLEPLLLAAVTIENCLRSGGKLLLCGNGGSAADAQHIAAEFVGRFQRERCPLPALALTTDSSILTAISNDYGFEAVFARQVQAWGQKEDVLLVISTSGYSPNILLAVQAARERGMQVMALTGKRGEVLAECVDTAVIIPSVNAARIQECHIIVAHLICEIVETALFPDAPSPLKLIPERVSHADKVVNWDTLLQLRAKWRETGQTVVWTNGCFDLVHVGHVRSLQAARQLGDLLVVGLNSDASVRQLKGADRPINPALLRAELLAAFGCVDYIVIFDELTPEKSLSLLQPEIHCKGADYAPPHGKPIPEAPIVEAYGGQVAFLPMTPFYSSTKLVQQIAASVAHPTQPPKPEK